MSDQDDQNLREVSVEALQNKLTLLQLKYDGAQEAIRSFSDELSNAEERLERNQQELRIANNKIITLEGQKGVSENKYLELETILMAQGTRLDAAVKELKTNQELELSKQGTAVSVIFLEQRKTYAKTEEAIAKMGNERAALALEIRAAMEAPANDWALMMENTNLRANQQLDEHAAKLAPFRNTMIMIIAMIALASVSTIGVLWMAGQNAIVMGQVDALSHQISELKK